MKRLDYKLTIATVSLFVSLILLILGGFLKNNYCLCFGLFFASIAMISFSFKEFGRLNELEKSILQETEEDYTMSDNALLELGLTLKTIKKQRKIVIWGGFAFSLLLIVVGIACLF